MGSAAKPSGPNWALLRKVCIFLFVAALAVTLRPWAQCTVQGMSAAEIGGVDAITGHGDGAAAGTGDYARADRANGFVHGFFGAVPACYRANPIGEASWQWPALLGLLAGVFVFRRLDRAQYADRVRRASAQWDAVGRNQPNSTGSHPNARGGAQHTPQSSRTVADERRERERMRR